MANDPSLELTFFLRLPLHCLFDRADLNNAQVYVQLFLLAGSNNNTATGQSLGEGTSVLITVRLIRVGFRAGRVDTVGFEVVLIPGDEEIIAGDGSGKHDQLGDVYYKDLG